MTDMNPMAHHTYAGLRHRELLAETAERRRHSAIRRLAKAARLERRAAGLSRRAAELVDKTHS